jgi:hypothetical protein
MKGIHLGVSPEPCYAVSSGVKNPEGINGIHHGCIHQCAVKYPAIRTINSLKGDITISPPHTKYLGVRNDKRIVNNSAEFNSSSYFPSDSLRAKS